MHEHCFICQRKIIPQDIIYEDDKVLVFLDLYPPTKGYTLVAIKDHLESITALSSEEYGYFQNVIHRTAQAIEKSFEPERISLLQIGGFVPHLHFHVIPIYETITKDVLEKIIFKHSEELPVGERKKISEQIKSNW